MRMWMCDPSIMCNTHLLCEHNELHFFESLIQQKKKLIEFLKKNWVEPESIESRHYELVSEMLKRKIKHNTPIKQLDLKYLGNFKDRSINKSLSLTQLLKSCPDCRERVEQSKE